MENEIFKAGVRPGGPTSHDEIKMLICYIMSGKAHTLTFAQLHEILLENGLVNYFELVQVVEGLVRTGHLALQAGKPEQYAITDMGKQAAHEFENALPLSVRQKALRAAELLMRREKRENEVRINTQKSGSGYRMELSIPSAGDNLLSFSLFLPTWEECERIRRRFLNDPVFIYKGVLALLTGDRDVLGDLFPEQNPLF